VHLFKFSAGSASITLEDGSTGTTDITVQQPVSRTLSVNMPTVVIPEGMSLLVAFPGIGFNHWRTDRNEGEAEEAFLLITPKVVSNEAQVVAQAPVQLSETLHRYSMPITLSLSETPVLSVEMQHLDTPEKAGYSTPAMRIIQNEWERFWMLDAPYRAENLDNTIR